MGMENEWHFILVTRFARDNKQTYAFFFAVIGQNTNQVKSKAGCSFAFGQRHYRSDINNENGGR